MKLGILGVSEGRSLMSAALKSDVIELVNICDLNEDLCKERCREFDFDRYTLKYDDLLANDEIEVIGIYTPERFHAEHILQAFRAGKQVVCTKPLLEGLARGREVLDAAQATGCWLFVGQSSRFFQPFIQQRRDFESGELGELLTIEAHYNYDHRWYLEKPWTDNSTFQFLYNCISHPGDFVRWYLPDVEEVMGYGMISVNGREMGLEHPDIMHFVLRAPDGRVARVSGSYTGPIQPVERESCLSTVLRCSKGCTQADYHELRYAKKIVGQPGVIQRFEGMEDYFFRFEGQSHHAGEYQNYLEYVARCLADGQSPKPDLAEGLVTLAMLQAMEVSMERGEPVRITDILKQHGLEELRS